MHIFLTGPIGIGKSTVIRKAVDRLKLNFSVSEGGFLTYDGLPEDKNVYLSPAASSKYYSISNRIATRNGFPPTPHTEVFETLGVEILRNCKTGANNLIIMDELGFLEENAQTFQETVLDCMERDIPILGSVKEKDVPWLSQIKTHPRVKLLPISLENRDEMVNTLVKLLTPYMKEMDGINNMWKLYDDLIDGIPKELTLEKIEVGAYRTAVYADGHVGLATTVYGQGGLKLFPDIAVGKTLKYSGKETLRAIASLIKSWDFTEASVGLAALNSYYNRLDLLPDARLNGAKLRNPAPDAFDFYENEVAGKKVAVIGHFKALDSKLKKVSSLSIIEREPKEGDYPDSAAEYLLPEQDFVFITGMTLQNKTLPRLLELSKNARVILTGPSLTLSDSLFKWGVETLSGFCVTHTDAAFKEVEKGTSKGFYQWGEKIILKRP